MMMIIIYRSSFIVASQEHKGSDKRSTTSPSPLSKLVSAYLRWVPAIVDRCRLQRKRNIKRISEAGNLCFTAPGLMIKKARRIPTKGTRDWCPPPAGRPSLPPTVPSRYWVVFHPGLWILSCRFFFLSWCTNSVSKLCEIWSLQFHLLLLFLRCSSFSPFCFLKETGKQSIFAFGRFCFRSLCGSGQVLLDKLFTNLTFSCMSLRPRWILFSFWCVRFLVWKKLGPSQEIDILLVYLCRQDDFCFPSSCVRFLVQ